MNSSIAPAISGPTSGNSTTTTSGSSSGGGKPNAGAISGGVVGGIVGFALLGVLLWFFIFRKKRRTRSGKSFEPVDLNGGPNDLEELDGGEVQAFSTSPTSPGETRSNGAFLGDPGSNNGYALPAPSSSGSREMTQARGPILTSIPQPPSSNATSYPRSSTLQSRYPDGISSTGQPSLADDSGDTYGHEYVPPIGASTSNLASDIPAPPITTATSQPRVKSPGVALPYTARPPTSALSRLSPAISDHLNSPIEERMSVPGREQDLGPLPASDEGHGGQTLPPDYQQATQPLPGQSAGRT